MAGVYIADPIYTLNARKLIENVTKARLAKDQLLRSHKKIEKDFREKACIHTGDFQDHRHHSIQPGKDQIVKAHS